MKIEPIGMLGLTSRLPYLGQDFAMGMKTDLSWCIFGFQKLADSLPKCHTINHLLT